MSSRRSKLFLSLRLFFWADVVLFIVLVSWFFYLRSQRLKLIDVVERQLAFNIRLSSDLAIANDIITNRCFSSVTSFVSNFVSSAASSLASVPSISSPSSPSSFSSSSSSSDDVPPIEFHSYGEINNRPFVMLGKKIYFEGDKLLGFPIQFISPSVVVYREKYIRVHQSNLDSVSMLKN